MASSSIASLVSAPQRAGCVLPARRGALRRPAAARTTCSRATNEAKHTTSAQAAAALLLLPAAAAAPAWGATSPSAGAVDQTADQLINGIVSAKEVVKQGLQLGGQAAGKAKDAYDTVSPYVKQAADAAAPVVAEGGKQVSRAVQSLQPQVEDLGKSTVQALKSSGVDASVIDGTASAVGGAMQQSKPLLQQLSAFLSNSTPVALAEYAAGGVLLYALAPSALRWLVEATRGYAGDLSAAAALDRVTSDGNAVIVDLRSRREKETGGLPDLPVRDRLLELEFAAIDDRKLRGQLRNPGQLETYLTALQVAALKRLSKTSTVLLLDRSGNAAKAVAKGLAGRGFRSAYVITGGFEGRGGWAPSKLPVRLAGTYSNAEVVVPKVVLPGLLPAAGGGAQDARAVKAAPAAPRQLPNRTQSMRVEQQRAKGAKTVRAKQLPTPPRKALPSGGN